MVRIWVASLHQKTSTYESTLRFLFYYKARLTGRVDSNNSGADRRLRRKQGGEAGAALRFFKALPRGLQKKRQAQLVRPAEWSGGQKSPCATATTAASGRSREELLGLRPAGCACRPRHDAAAGSRDPGSFLFCAARDIHPRPPKNLNVSRCIPLFLFHLSLKAALPCRVTKKDALRSLTKRLCL